MSAHSADRVLRHGGWLRDIRGVVGLSVPLATAQLGQIAMITTDVVMVGWLGALELAAMSLGHAAEHFFLLFVFGIASASAPLVAQALGARKPRQLRRAVRQGIWAVITVCVPAMIMLWHIAPVLHGTGQGPALIPLTELYVRSVLWSLLPMAGIVVLRSFVSAFGQARIVLIITLIAVPLNALADYLLIFGNFGFPELGIAGAGYATTVISSSMFLALAFICARARRFRRYAIWVRFWKPDWGVYAQTFRIGLPIGLTLLMEVGLFVSGVYIIGSIDPAQVAGTQIALQLASITFMVPLGIGQAATTRIGLAAGKGDRGQVRREGIIAAGIGALFMAAMGVIFWAANESLVGIFLDETDALAASALAFGALFLMVAAVFQLFDGLQVIALSALRGLNDTRIPMLLAFFAYWLVGFPTAWIMAFVFDLEGLGVWIGLLAALATASVVLTWRFLLMTRPSAGLASPRHADVPASPRTAEMGPEFAGSIGRSPEH